ncbi:MAG TPA: hypothetical protein VLJ39_20205 [Tepidisphaeraceae bacterium]|nr:hypothetical protein [Tepidisphaeraceae bacterium]
MLKAWILVAGLVAVGGCSSEPQGNPGEANAAESQPYAAGTGVSSSSFERHPRFYTGPDGEPSAAPTTQPASGK